MNRILGSSANIKEALWVLGLMLLVTAGYEYALSLFVDGFAFNWLEFVGTWFTMATVWLCRTQNILNWPIGIIGVSLLGAFFAQIGLPGQQWLQWLFFVPVSVWAWYQWAFGGENRTERKVSDMGFIGFFVSCFSLVFGTYLVYKGISWFNPWSTLPWLDATVVASSIVAQVLLALKKVESWWLWLLPVNALSIFLFWTSGAYLVTGLYVAFFVHAAIATYEWTKELRAGRPAAY